MKAHVTSVRIAPKKANLVAKMVRGMPVPAAIEALRLTHKKAARIIELLVRSAVANASHNDRQDAQMMVVKTIVVNQGQALSRGVPMARGRVRPMKKFMSHISVTLGFAEDKLTPKPKRVQPVNTPPKKASKAPSQRIKNAVKTPRTSTKKQKEISAEDTSASDSSLSTAVSPRLTKADESSVSSAS